MPCARGSWLPVALLFLVHLGVSACDEPTLTLPGPTDNGDGGTPTLAGLTQIQVMPPTVSLTLDSDTPQTQKFTAIGVFNDMHTEDVTDRVTWTVSPTSLGSFQGVSTFSTGGYGGQGQVFAYSGSLFGSATIFIRVTRTIVDPSAPPGAGPGSFTGTPDAKNPAVVYPYDQVMMPPNLGALEYQWQRGNAAHTLFEVSMQNKVTDLQVYTACSVVNGGCVYALQRHIWDIMANSNLGNTDPVLVTVRSTDGKTVGTSAPIKLFFSPEAIRGGIYYWTAISTSDNDRSSAIWRIDLDKGTLQSFYTTQQSPPDHEGQVMCIGCHSISHDGQTLSLILGGAHISDMLQFSVMDHKQTLTKIDTTPTDSWVKRQYSNFQTYSSDGTSFVAALRGNLRLVSTTTGANLIPSLLSGANATHPDWSASGAILAYTRFSDPVTTPTNFMTGDGSEIFLTRGSIGVSHWNGTAFDQGSVLVAEKANQNSYYPSVAPNDQYFVFSRVPSCTRGTINPQTSNDDCTAYDNPKVQVYMVSMAGNDENALVNVNKRGPTDTRDTNTNSWPKWSPFKQSTAGGRTLMWVTFSSKRNYGVRLLNNTDRPQLWMAAITVGGEPTGTDPSSPPFWIPTQNLQTHNHIAQWTEQIVPILQ